jgi:hypothetical protein
MCRGKGVKPHKNKTRNFLLSPACHCKAVLRILALQVPAVDSPNFRPARPPRLVSGTSTSMGGFPFRECGSGVSNRYNLDYLLKGWRGSPSTGRRHAAGGGDRRRPPAPRASKRLARGGRQGPGSFVRNPLCRSRMPNRLHTAPCKSLCYVGTQHLD